MKLVKLEDGTIVEVQEISNPVDIGTIDARIAGLKSTIENLQNQIAELEESKMEFEKLSKK